MSRYNINEEEVKTLASSILGRGSLDTYNMMRSKAMLEAENNTAIVSNLLDMSEDFLSRGRSEIFNDSGNLIINVMYTLHSLLRKLAHEVAKKYKIEDDRLIRLVSYNEDIPRILE